MKRHLTKAQLRAIHAKGYKPSGERFVTLRIPAENVDRYKRLRGGMPEKPRSGKSGLYPDMEKIIMHVSEDCNPETEKYIENKKNAWTDCEKYIGKTLRIVKVEGSMMTGGKITLQDGTILRTTFPMVQSIGKLRLERMRKNGYIDLDVGKQIGRHGSLSGEVYLTLG